MEKSTKRKLLIGGALVVVLGVGGFLFWRYRKKKKEEEEQKQAEADATATTSTTPTTAGGSVSSYGPFKSSSEVKAFQDWMDKNHPNWVNGKNLNKGTGYGVYGPSTKSAWNSYGTEYKKPTTTQPTTPPPVDPNKIVIGDRVWVNSPIPSAWKTADNGVSGYTGSGLVTKFNSGGIRYGNFYAGVEAGTVTDVNAAFKSVKVKNTTYPMVSANGNYVTEFWMPLATLTKVKPSWAFDGMTVTYQSSTL